MLGLCGYTRNGLRQRTAARRYVDVSQLLAVRATRVPGSEAQELYARYTAAQNPETRLA